MNFLLILAFTFKSKHYAYCSVFVCVIRDKYFQNSFIFDLCMYNLNIFIIMNDSSKVVLINIISQKKEKY